MKMFCIVAFMCVSAFVSDTSGAAIPMWEFLSKDEKMSYLYSTFANQVEEFCEYSEMNNCNQELMKFGLKKLKDMSEDHLDTMDPYQRGAHSLIWDSFMAGHHMMQATKKPKHASSTAQPNSYEDQSFGDFGSESEASAKIETIYKDNRFNYRPQYNILTGNPQYKYPQNGQYVVDKIQSQKQPEFTENVDTNVDLDDPYDAETGYDNIPIREEYGRLPLTGPMVVIMRPDGTPVKEDVVRHDEDLTQYRLSKTKIPL